MIDNNLDFQSIPDEWFSQKSVATLYAILCIIEIERRGWIKTSFAFHESAFRGGIYRSFRLQIECSVADILAAVAGTLPCLKFAPEEQERVYNLCAHVLNDVLATFKPPPPAPT